MVKHRTVSLRAWDPGSGATDLVPADHVCCDLHGSIIAALLSTLPELGAAEHVTWLPILAESVAAQHQDELKVVRGDHAAHEGASNPGASADEDWAALNAKFE